jgi:orotate phosphoribosyltransferase
MSASVSADSVKSLFLKTGALLAGHFQLSSGLHSPNYMQCALLLSDPQTSQRLGAALAELAPRRPDLILSPALGGVVIGQEVARALKVRHYFMEREHGALTLRRGFSLSPGERFLVVEDVVTTGKSSREVIAEASARGAKSLGVLSIVDRTGGKSGLPLKSLLAMEIPAVKADDCPLCKQGLPLVKPGSRPQPQ